MSKLYSPLCREPAIGNSIQQGNTSNHYVYSLAGISGPYDIQFKIFLAYNCNGEIFWQLALLFYLHINESLFAEVVFPTVKKQLEPQKQASLKEFTKSKEK